MAEKYFSYDISLGPEQRTRSTCRGAAVKSVPKQTFLSGLQLSPSPAPTLSPATRWLTRFTVGLRLHWGSSGLHLSIQVLL